MGGRASWLSDAGTRLSGLRDGLISALSNAGPVLSRMVLRMRREMVRLWQARVFGLWVGPGLVVCVVAAFVGAGLVALLGGGEAGRHAGVSEEPASERVAVVRNTRYTTRANVEIDVSSRTVAVTSAFSGTEIIVFGAVEDDLPNTEASGPPDVVVAVKGRSHDVTIRRKSNVGGLWLNTDAVVFEDVPSFYALAATRPLTEVTYPFILEAHDIGAGRVLPAAPQGVDADREASAAAGYRAALLRLKQADGLYVAEAGEVVFTGRTLFRATIRLPANVPVGDLAVEASVFRDKEFLAQVEARVSLKRQGVERLLHELAHDHSTLYGVLAVILAVVAGLAASAIFQRRER